MCLWGCFQERLAFQLVNWVKQMPPTPTNVGEYHSICWGLNRTKKQRKGEFALSLSKLRYPSSSALGHEHSWFLSFWTQIGIYTISLLCRHPQLPFSSFRLRLNYTTHIPGSLACTRLTVGLLSLYNWVSQFL